jgi:hypothetical protein
MYHAAWEPVSVTIRFDPNLGFSIETKPGHSPQVTLVVDWKQGSQPMRSHCKDCGLTYEIHAAALNKHILTFVMNDNREGAYMNARSPADTNNPVG